MLSAKTPGLNTRREIIRYLVSLGISNQDIATVLNIHVGSVMNDFKNIGHAKIHTNMNLSQRRDNAFNCAMREWFAICDISDCARKLGVDQETARGIMNALEIYLDIRHFNSVAEGAMVFVDTMMCLIDPPEYVPYRRLLYAVLGERLGMERIRAQQPLKEFDNLINSNVLLTRDSFASQLAGWALAEYRSSWMIPLGESAKNAIDEVIRTIPHERSQKVIRLRFGLDGGRVLPLREIAKQFDVTFERIRQIEGRGLRQLRHPERARQLRLFLESPFDFTQRTLEEMFPPATS